MTFDKEEFKNTFAKRILSGHDKSPEECTPEEAFEALTAYVFDVTSEIRAKTSARHIAEKSKKVYYFSMEYLIGPLLENYLINLGIRDGVEEALSEFGISLSAILSLDIDPGLGNGGLGRLAACFLDSMASMGISGVGIGLRYQYGLFRQKIDSGYQKEFPDSWLENGYPWEVCVPSDSCEVHFGGRIERSYKDGKLSFRHVDYECVQAVPYMVPILGYGGRDCNALHLYSAKPANSMLDLEEFNKGNYEGAMKQYCEAKAITSVLYPNDNQEAGKRLRLKQEYFLICAGLESVFRTYKKRYPGEAWSRFPEHVAIQTNDTHPALIIPELMRRLMDEEGLEWDEAWDITTRTVGYTNHTVLPEAAEKWPQNLIQTLLPRIYMIIEEIDRRWKAALPAADRDLAAGTAILWGGEARMANMSVIGSHSVNGVAKIHSEILKRDLFKEFYALSPEKFSNKTNGVSHRRFLIQANPALSRLITDTIGEEWKTDFDKISELNKYSDNKDFLEKLYNVKRENKERLAEYIAEKNHIQIDPCSVVDVHVKRIHAYKRQLLTGFKILNLYNRIKEDPGYDIPPVTFVVGGKAAPGYDFAKEVIKFICSIADKVNSDPAVCGRIKVVFVENFSISNAQIIYPAADISEQISTAGKEASGTGNMKFMMNGAITLGTMDGANIEIFERCGKENAAIFGLSAEEAEQLALSGKYSAEEECKQNPELSRMMDQLINGFFGECSFWGIYDSLIKYNDEYFVIRDFPSYYDVWEKLVRICADKDACQRMALANIANSSYFSSDRTIREYAEEIWSV